jgi:hypothetical protein
VLSFDAAFDAQPHTQLLKEQLSQVEFKGYRTFRGRITWTAVLAV